MSVFILGKKDPRPKDGIVIDTTSQSRTWSRGLSPFFLGPVEVAPGIVAKNVENAWQFSKVYERHMKGMSGVTQEYFNWAQSGFEDTYAHRYPMGKGAVPAYSVKILHVGDPIIHSNIKLLSYIEARKELYIPFYSKAVVESEAYSKLEDLMYNERQNIYLLDFDGYDHKSLGMSYQDVIEDPTRKMGHGFVLGMLLEGVIK